MGAQEDLIYVTRLLIVACVSTAYKGVIINVHAVGQAVPKHSVQGKPWLCLILLKSCPFRFGLLSPPAWRQTRQGDEGWIHPREKSIRNREL